RRRARLCLWPRRARARRGDQRLPRLCQGRARLMVREPDTGAKPVPGSPEARESGRRNLNSQIAQRQKVLLAGIGAAALIGGAMFIFGGDGDNSRANGNGAASIDTGGLVNRNLASREFVAVYGNRLDAQGRAIKDLQQAQLPRPEIEQELEA